MLGHAALPTGLTSLSEIEVPSQNRRTHHAPIKSMHSALRFRTSGLTKGAEEEAIGVAGVELFTRGHPRTRSDAQPDVGTGQY